MSNLANLYKSEVAPALMSKFGYKSTMQIPKIDKVVINIGVGEAKDNQKALDTAILVKNGPSYAALGFGGEGYCTFTIASRTGEGLTAGHSFTKSRRCTMSDSLCIR